MNETKIYRTRNALATVQEIVGIAPNYDIASCISNKMNITKSTEHENIKCDCDVYQADVYSKHKQRTTEECFVLYPIKTYKQTGVCCCPDDQLSGNNVDDSNADSIEVTQLNSSSRERETNISTNQKEQRLHLNQRNDVRHHFDRTSDVRHQNGPGCCIKNSCKKSSSECSRETTNSDASTKLIKKLEKREKKERESLEKRKSDEEKMRLKAYLKDIKKREKRKKKKSKCTCLRDIKKVNDKCCTTSLEPVGHPGSLKCRSTSPTTQEKHPTDPAFKEQVPSTPIIRPYPIRKRKSRRKSSIPSTILKADSAAKAQLKLDSNDQTTQAIDDRVPCCTCKKPINQEQMDPERQNLVNEPYNSQMILNRNINIYLQIEKFCKQKPILLSRRQYEKVKKVIEGKRGFSKYRKNWRSERCCACSVGKVREKDVETEVNDVNNMSTNVRSVSRAGQVDLNNSLLFMTKNETVITSPQMKSIGVSPKHSLIRKINQDAGSANGSNKNKEITNIKENTKKTQYIETIQEPPKENIKNTQRTENIREPPKENTKKTQCVEFIREPPNENTNKTESIEKIQELCRHTQNIINYRKSLKGHKSYKSSGFKCAQCGRKNGEVANCSISKKKEIIARCEAQQHYMDNLCNICKMVQDLEGDIIYPVEKQRSSARRAASSAEIHYANINTAKRVTFSSSYLDDNFLRQGSSHVLLKKVSSNTLYTLFKGRYEFH